MDQEAPQVRCHLEEGRRRLEVEYRSSERDEKRQISTPMLAHRRGDVLTFASDALSASEYFLALLAGGGLS